MKKTIILLCPLLSLIACNPVSVEDNENVDSVISDPGNAPVFILSDLDANDPAVALPGGGTSAVTIEWGEPWTASSS